MSEERNRDEAIKGRQARRAERAGRKAEAAKKKVRPRVLDTLQLGEDVPSGPRPARPPRPKTARRGLWDTQ